MFPVHVHINVVYTCTGFWESCEGWAQHVELCLLFCVLGFHWHKWSHCNTEICISTGKRFHVVVSLVHYCFSHWKTEIKKPPEDSFFPQHEATCLLDEKGDEVISKLDSVLQSIESIISRFKQKVCLYNRISKVLCKKWKCIGVGSLFRYAWHVAGTVFPW